MNKYELVALSAIEELKNTPNVDVKEAWDIACKKLNADRCKYCPLQTYLWILKYVLNSKLNSIPLNIKIDKENQNGKYARFAICIFEDDNSIIEEKSSLIWREVQNVASLNNTPFASSHNAQIDVVKAFYKNYIQNNVPSFCKNIKL